MKKVIVSLVFVLSCILVFAQDNLAKDEFGHTPRSVDNHKIFQQLNQLEDANEWTSIGPFGGDVFDIAVDPMNTDVIFAAAGVPYKSMDGGESWQYIESLLNLSPSGIGTFEAASNGVIYASGPYSYYKIFRSSDGGETWEQKSIPVNGAGNDIAIDPNDPNIIYMALTVVGGSSNYAIVKSEDGGDSWTYFNLTNVLPMGWTCVDLIVDPDDSQVIFAIGNESFSNAKVVATVDGGTTWEDRTGNLPTGKPYNKLTISDGNVYIAGGQLFGNQIMGIYKTENYGLTWQNISTTFPNKVSNAIEIDPTDTDKMYVASEGDGIYYSTDGGSTWNYNTSGAGDNGAARCLTFNPENTDVIYAGFLSLAVCKSEDAALNWVFANKGIATLQTDDVEVNPNNPMNMLVGFEAENSGGCYLTNDGGETWQLVEGLPGTRFSQVTFGADEAMYAWSNGPSSIAQEGLYKSTDGGVSWDNMGPNLGSYFETEVFGLAASATNVNLILIGGSDFGVAGFESKVYRTADGGDSWDSVFVGPTYNSFNFIFIDPNSSDQTLYGGYSAQDEHAGFIKSIDEGVNWLDINTGIPGSNKWGGAIVTDPANSDIVYCGVGGWGNLNGTIYKSFNGGSSWETTSLNLQTYSKVTDIMISPLNSDVVYAATTQDGVYYSEGAGDVFEPANDGLPATYMTGFSNPFQVDDAWYFCGSTFSNSTFKTEVFDPNATGLQTINFNESQVIVYPNPTDGPVCFQLSDNCPVPELIQVFNSLGQLIYEQQKQNIENQLIKVDINFKAGIYIWKIRFAEEEESGRIVVR